MAGAVDRLKERVDTFQRGNRFAGFVYGVVKKAGDDKGSHLAALITYYGFFSLFPLLLVAFTILGFVLQGNESLRNDVASTLQERLPLPGITADSLNGSGLALVIGVAADAVVGSRRHPGGAGRVEHDLGRTPQEAAELRQEAARRARHPRGDRRRAHLGHGGVLARRLPRAGGRRRWRRRHPCSSTRW
ncbi:MAG: YhjD/YihY/BrkB family envelope integrity protein [Microthrixaceae bacterium]